MQDCIFCKIVKKELPSYVVYEDEHVLAFLDISPINHGHTLVIPKEHFSNYEEIPDDKMAKVYSVVKKIGAAMKEGLGIPGYNTGVNNDPVAGQIIPHFHVHIIPRHENDGLELWASGTYKEGEAEEVLNKIKNNL